MIVIGIDPGTAITGYGLVEDDAAGSLRALAYGVIRTDAGQALPERLVSLHKQLQDILVLYQPQSAAVENLFFQRNARSAIGVGQARGVALLALAQRGIPVCDYSPMEVKQAVSGYGGAEKNQVQQMVRALLSLDSIPQPDDAADALAVAICHLHSDRIKGLISEAGGGWQA